MTRLKEDDINEIAATLASYDSELIRKTGCSLLELASHAVGRDLNEVQGMTPRVAVIPMTCGQGIIEGFVQAVASILNHLGFKAWITESSDAGGVAEAVQKGAEILFMADDDRFVAINLRTGVVSDNGAATGRGYVAGLERMCDGLEGKDVLLLGAGPVGLGAALALAQFRAKISVFDLDRAASERLAKKLEKNGYAVMIETNLDFALKQHHLLVDACPAENIIASHYLTERTILAAPGIPLGIESVGIEQIAPRLLHDPLQIGVATMLLQVL